MVALEEDPLKQDFRKFLYLVWKYLNLPDPTPVQYDIAKYLQGGPKRRIIEAFRGVGKSWLTVAYVVWRFYCDPETKVLVVSASKNLADNFSTFALQLIHGMPELQHLAPRDDQRSSKVQFDVGTASPSKDPSLRSVGITGQITGSRADLIVADDIEVPGNSATQMMRDKLSESVKEFDAVLKPGGEVVYLGTPQTEMSIYNQLPTRGYDIRIWPARYPRIEDEGIYGTRIAPSILKCLESSGNGLAKDSSIIGQPTDPLRFTDLDLKEREASYGRSGFALQFMLDTRLSDANRYPLKLEDLVVMALPGGADGPAKVIWCSAPEKAWKDLPNVGFNGDRYYQPMEVQGPWSPWQGSVMAIDPAGRGKDEVGYAVVKMLNGALYLTAAGGLTGGYKEDNLVALAQIARDQKVNWIRIEPNFGDGMFDQLFKPVLGRIYPCTIDPEPARSSIQKEKRIIDTLEPVMNQHRLVVDKKLVEQDFRSTEHLPMETGQKYQLFYQLTRITRDKGALIHDDRLDAVAQAVQYWTEQMGRDIDKAVENQKERLLEDSLKTFMDHVLGGDRMSSDHCWM